MGLQRVGHDWTTKHSTQHITIDVTVYTDITEYELRLCHIANNIRHRNEILLHIPSQFAL